MRPAVRLLFLGFLVAVAVAGGPQARAAGTAINVNEEGVALDGYDTVSYFTPVGARRGTAEFQTEWAGAFWYFATADSNWPVVRQQLLDDEAAISRKWF